MKNFAWYNLCLEYSWHARTYESKLSHDTALPLLKPETKSQLPMSSIARLAHFSAR